MYGLPRLRRPGKAHKLILKLSAFRCCTYGPPQRVPAGILCFVLLALSCFVFAVWIVNGELSPYSGDEGRSLKLIL